jgi:hypothetical protein
LLAEPLERLVSHEIPRRELLPDPAGRAITYPKGALPVEENEIVRGHESPPSVPLDGSGAIGTAVAPPELTFHRTVKTVVRNEEHGISRGREILESIISREAS